VEPRRGYEGRFLATLTGRGRRRRRGPRRERPEKNLSNAAEGADVVDVVGEVGDPPDRHVRLVAEGGFDGVLFTQGDVAPRRVEIERGREHLPVARRARP